MHHFTIYFVYYFVNYVLCNFFSLHKMTNWNNLSRRCSNMDSLQEKRLLTWTNFQSLCGRNSFQEQKLITTMSLRVRSESEWWKYWIWCICMSVQNINAATAFLNWSSCSVFPRRHTCTLTLCLTSHSCRVWKDGETCFFIFLGILSICL